MKEMEKTSEKCEEDKQDEDRESKTNEKKKGKRQPCEKDIYRYKRENERKI